MGGAIYNASQGDGQTNIRTRDIWWEVWLCKAAFLDVNFL